jgi:hypothetical protein
MLPVIIGFAVLAIDMARVNNLHNDLQKGADAFALAGAAELDGHSDAITRANRAIDNLIANQTDFSTLGHYTLTKNDIYPPVFLDSLPTSDSIALDKDGNEINAAATSHGTTDPAKARFVEITVKGANFSTIFPASFIGGPDSFQVAAQAVAGYGSAICDVTPMFICNPFEPDGLSFQDAFAQGKTYSRLFTALKTSDPPGPGNFGLLDFDDSISIREAFAKGSGGQCYEQTVVTTKPGVTLGQVNSGLNVRFDIYSGSIKGYNTDPEWRPSVNVRKGADKTSNCNKFKAATDGSAMGFPPGSAGTYPNQTGVSGDYWDRSAYWTLNHGTSMPTIASTSDPVSSSAPPSRYDVYRYEIEQGLVGDHAGGKSSGETGTPLCYKGNSDTLTEDPDRRVIIAAIVDCAANAGKIAGRTDLSPDAYASIFLTNPIQKNDPSVDDEDPGASEKPIDFEVVDVTGPKGNGTLDKLLHDEAQLYR